MAGRIPQQFVDDLLARVDIIDLIESYLPLRKAGRDFQALCPFHGEKTPSFTISREKQFYHCFGCGAHGSAIGFLMKYRNLEFVEAVEELAAIAGVEIPREAHSKRSSDSRGVFDALNRAQAFYVQELKRAPTRERAVEYLKGRGISGEIARQFHLGYAADGWRNLLDALGPDDTAEAVLERAGLVIKRDRGGCYDRFRDRIMFPIRDRRGRVIGFGGRIIDKGDPKYLNSPETEVFHKGRELYGLHEALAADPKLRRMLVVEGYMDVIALHQFGLPQVVATLGTAVSREHVEQLFRHVPEIVFCFDGDAAGRRAAWKALEISLPLVAGNRQVRFAFLPEGHDPDSAIRAFGADGFFSAAQIFGLSEYLLDILKLDTDLSSGDGRARLIAKAKPYLLQIPDLAHRATGVALLATLTRFDEDLLRRELGFAGTRPASIGTVATVNRYSSRPLAEQAVALLLQRPELASEIADDDAAFIRAELPECALLLAVRQIAIADSPTTTARLLERLRGDSHEERLAALAAQDLNIDESLQGREMRDATARLVQRAEDERFRRINAIPFGDWTEDQRNIVRNYKRER